MPTTKFQLQYQEMDSEESIFSLADALESVYINNTIKIPPKSGNGIIRKIKIEDGLYMRVWDFQLNRPLRVSKIADEKSEDKVFHIGFLLNPEALLLRIEGMRKEIRAKAGRNILFMSNDASSEIEVITENNLQAIDISFTASWLAKTFVDAEAPLQQFISHILNNPKPTVFLESTSSAEYRGLIDIHSCASADARPTLQIKAGVLSLLSGFFNKMCNKSVEVTMGNRFFYADKMMEVEKILKAHLEKRLPGIEAIARQVALGESTLKRHFKLMFGKSIYEYYLEIKMDFAKRVILEQELSVNQVATMLDYEKVSNFIDMFKRHHGMSPGAFRHSLG